MGIADLAPHYQVILERRGPLDEVIVETEATRELEGQLGEAVLTGDTDSWQAHEEVIRLQHKVITVLREAMGLHFDVRVLTPGTLPRSEGKAIRVIDRRQ
jgi:phenylacetate-CoA ligase